MSDETNRLDIEAIEARAQRQASDVPLPECKCEKRGHAPCCFDCYLAYQAAVGPTFEACGRGDVLALVAEVRRLREIVAQHAAEKSRLTREAHEAMEALTAEAVQCYKTAKDRMQKDLDAACAEHDAEVNRLRTILAGRPVAPTDAEIIAHHAAGGSWLVGFGRTRETVDTMRTARAIRSHATRWWPLSREGCPCAWPVVEVTRG